MDKTGNLETSHTVKKLRIRWAPAYNTRSE